MRHGRFQYSDATWAHCYFHDTSPISLSRFPLLVHDPPTHLVPCLDGSVCAHGQCAELFLGVDHDVFGAFADPGEDLVFQVRGPRLRADQLEFWIEDLGREAVVAIGGCHTDLWGEALVGFDE